MDVRTIWNEAQNRPTLVVRDICNLIPDVSESDIYTILLRRGIFKWLAARRDIIRLKNKWKKEITRLYGEIRKYPRGSMERRCILARIRAFEECRKAVRAICHSARWRAPDNDRHAQRFLKNIEKGAKPCE